MLLYIFSWPASVLAVLMIVTPGCTRLADHPKTVVAVPAIIGQGVGVIPGAALFIVASPIMLTATAFESPNTRPVSGSIAMYTLGLPSYLTGTALATPSWLVFGWWGLDPEKETEYGTPRVFLPHLDGP